MIKKRCYRIIFGQLISSSVLMNVAIVQCCVGVSHDITVNPVDVGGTFLYSGMQNFRFSSASRRINLNKEFEHNVDKLLLWKQQLILKKKIASLQAI